MNPEQVPQLGKSRIILETDTATPGTTLTSTENDRSPNGCLFKQIREFMFSNFVHCIVSICSRLCNRVEDSLASHGACNLKPDSHVYLSQAPDFVMPLVSDDLSGTSA